MFVTLNNSISHDHKLSKDVNNRPGPKEFNYSGHTLNVMSLNRLASLEVPKVAGAKYYISYYTYSMERFKQYFHGKKLQVKICFIPLSAVL